VTVPALAVVATFEMKRVRQTGNFMIDLNKFTTDSLTMRFDENIGDLRGLFGDAGHFRQVNLDDPLYRQREILAFVDGLNTQDFGQFINFVSVHLRKKHAEGAITDDEVRIDRNNFNQAGNAFKMLYGWKGDNDRRRWMEYEYQTTWSFFGGQTVEEPWRQGTANAITLAPPYLRNAIEVQASPDTLTAANVRLVTARLFYALGGQEQVKQVTLNPGKQQLSQAADIILPRNSPDYGYEINWRLADGRTVSSGRKTSSDAILFAEPVPAP
jgi:hypothetical protein